MFRKNITTRPGNMVSLPILPVHRQEEKTEICFFKTGREIQISGKKLLVKMLPVKAGISNQNVRLPGYTTNRRGRTPSCLQHRGKHLRRSNSTLGHRVFQTTDGTKLTFPSVAWRLGDL